MPRAGGCDKYGGTKLHDTTYADSRAGAVSCNMTAIPPARLLCRNEYEQAPLSYRGSGTYMINRSAFMQKQAIPKEPVASYKEIRIGKTLYRVTSVFSGEKDLGRTLEQLAVRRAMTELDAPAAAQPCHAS